MLPPSLLVISQIELIYMHTRSPHLQLALASGFRSRKDPYLEAATGSTLWWYYSHPVLLYPPQVEMD